MCCIKLPPRAKVGEDIPSDSVRCSHHRYAPIGKKALAGFGGKGFPPFLSPSAMSLFPAALSCNSKGRKGGNSLKTKRWKDWYIPSNLHWWAGGGTQLLCLKIKRWAEALEGPQECQSKTADLDWRLDFLKWAAWYLNKASMARPETSKL